MLLNAQNLTKHYGERLIFSLDRLGIYHGDKIGIIGSNGSGKTTLLRVLIGDLPPDNGSVDVKSKIAYVQQLGDTQGYVSGIQSGIFSVKVDPKSGGEIMRKKLAFAFSQNFDILALDEPSSNLDADGIEILDSMLYGVETLIMISHDKRLLDIHCNKILEVSNGQVRLFNGNYTDYCQIIQAENDSQIKKYNSFIKEQRRLQDSLKESAEHAAKIKKAPSRMGNSEARLHKRQALNRQAKLHRAANQIDTRLEKLQAVDKPKEIPKISLDFSLTNPPKNKIILSAKNLCFGYNDNLIFKNASFDIENGKKVAIVGSNGSGKTTLINLICNSPDIYKVPLLRLGYLSQDFCEINLYDTVLENVLETAVQNQTVCRIALANLGFRGDDVYKSASTLSGGELIKLGIARLIVSNANALILDEPTNYLDIQSITQVQNALLDYKGSIIFVSHDYTFVDSIADATLKIVDKALIWDNTP